jgi:protein-L-isoaspartate O-methyltransferase
MTDLRRDFVEQVQRGCSLSPELATAFATVPREVFVPEGFRRRNGTWAKPGDRDFLALVYRDDVLVTKLRGRTPISSSSQPSLMAIMIMALDVRPGLRILEIGAGTGYNAALLASLGATVTSVDVQQDVADRARAALVRAGIGGVRVVHGDGYTGVPGETFDRVIVTVGIAGISPHWLDQVKPGSVVIAPVEHAGTHPVLAVRQTFTAGASPALAAGASPAPTAGASPAPTVGASPAPAAGASPALAPGANPALAPGANPALAPGANPALAAGAGSGSAVGIGSGSTAATTHRPAASPDVRAGSDLSLAEGSQVEEISSGSALSPDDSRLHPGYAVGSFEVPVGSSGSKAIVAPPPGSAVDSDKAAGPGRDPREAARFSAHPGAPPGAGAGGSEPAGYDPNAGDGVGPESRSGAPVETDLRPDVAVNVSPREGTGPVVVSGAGARRVTASVVCAAGFMTAAGPLTADHPGAHPAPAQAKTLADFEQMAPPRFEPALDSLSYRNLCYAAGVWNRRTSHGAIPGYEQSCLILLDEARTGGAVILPDGAVLAGGTEANRYAIEAVAIVDRWSAAGSPPMQAWRVTLGPAGDPQAPIWVPESWSLR